MLGEEGYDRVERVAQTVTMNESQNKQQRFTSTLQQHSLTTTITASSPGILTFVIPDLAVDIGQAVLKVTHSINSNVTITVDGVDVPVTWDVNNNTYTSELDIQDWLYNEDGTVSGEHIVQVIGFQSGGEVEIIVEVVEIGLN